VLYISHKLQEIFELADMVTVLRDGQHINTLPVSEVNEDKLVQMMVGRELELSARRGEVKPGEVRLRVESLSGRGFSKISFELRAGEVLGVAGLVGSGRSELVETIFGVLPVTEGRILLGAEDITRHSVAYRAGLGMALVPEDRQFAGIIFTMVLKQNLSLPGVVLGAREFGRLVISGARESKVACETMQKLRVVAGSPEAEMQSLSGGNQQKVVIGKWLLLKPSVFILDEPTRGIDVGAKAEIHKLIRELADQGRAVLVVSSELPELLALADRILVMREGRLMGEVCGERRCEQEIMRLAVAGVE
jgi:ABC-type sugar transport system ATPase subunit